MKKTFLFVFIIILSIFSTTISYCEKTSNDLQNNIFRLHIIANSNTQYDQNIKFLVRDRIIDYMKKNINDINSLEECIEYMNANIDSINNEVRKVLLENNCNIDFSSCISKEFFPTKKYENYSFPAGTYNCLKIKLGSFEGENWWCVLYPNLCICDTSSRIEEDNRLKNSITTSSYDLVTSNVSYKFKIVELYEKIKNIY